jgi:RNA polymerase sigma factor (sigma-70 family)
VDAVRLGELVDKHAAALELYAAQWTAAPEDCVQEAFIELAGQDPPPQNAVGWLYRVVRNRAINAGRGERRRERHEQVAARSLRERLAPQCPTDAVDVDEVSSSLAQLDEAYREVIVLRIWSELTLGEIAELLGCSTTTIHRRYQAGLLELRSLLEKDACPNTTPCR